MTIRLHRGDLPDLKAYKGAVAIDTETMGLEPARDRLCVVQLSPATAPPTWCRSRPGRRMRPTSNVCSPTNRFKDFSFCALRYRRDGQGFRRHGRAGLLHQLASRLARSDTHTWLEGYYARSARRRSFQAAAIIHWGADELSDAQVAYAATDVLHLDGLKNGWTPCWRAKATPICGVQLPLSARPGAARSRRLGGRGHFFAFRVRRGAEESAGCAQGARARRPLSYWTVAAIGYARPYPRAMVWLGDAANAAFGPIQSDRPDFDMFR